MDQEPIQIAFVRGMMEVWSVDSLSQTVPIIIARAYSEVYRQFRGNAFFLGRATADG